MQENMKASAICWVLSSAVCVPPCENGVCNRPGTCVCEPGWTGSRCRTGKQGYIQCNNELPMGDNISNTCGVHIYIHTMCVMSSVCVLRVVTLCVDFNLEYAYLHV